MQTSSERVNEGLCVAGFRCGWCSGENSSREQHLVKYAYTLRLTYVGVVAHVRGRTAALVCKPSPSAMCGIIIMFETRLRAYLV
jgi:hypothetical protein